MANNGHIEMTVKVKDEASPVLRRIEERVRRAADPPPRRSLSAFLGAAIGLALWALVLGAVLWATGYVWQQVFAVWF